MNKIQYYSSKKIDKENAHYNVIFGERSNGKTYAILRKTIENWFRNNKQSAIVRRWQDDFKSKRGATMYAALSEVIKKESNDAFDHVDYYGGRFFMAAWEVKASGERVSVRDNVPFAYGFALSAMEHDKSTSYPDIDIILFDEFITRDSYLQDEFILFMNVVSTIVRQRRDVKIYMLGNTVNKFCPYFAEMGLSHVKDMKPGQIDVYTYGESGLLVAVERTGTSTHNKKESDVYFAFNNPKLKMITHGSWEIDIYPHLMGHFRSGDVLHSYFIIWEGEILQADIVLDDLSFYTYIHRKTTEIKNPDSDIIFQIEPDKRYNYYKNLKKPTDNISKKIANFFRSYKVFYQDNEVGEIVRNYLQWCDKN